ncbi:hypothetical protein BVC80_9069g24 [Macleaya cordata]|uniref:DDT domain-containing protein n=1 Tax=Macleaya cordata TaxID=56857 RepID=A0A200PNX3_MACCD|nr:hypothetical protein BVC80_9069g24 [Macleaya cordata]
MTEKRGRRKPPLKVEEEKEGFVEDEDPMTEKPSIIPVSSLSESQIARLRLRERWELASVLNFLHVFKPVIQIDLEFSAEDIETALITPNNILSQLHISLLKGIPPVSKNLTSPDAWVTTLCKKLNEWWPWVDRNGFLLVLVCREEISRYKDLDPTVRLVILKALCELRADQDDALSYMNDALKNGTEISTFRKDRLGEDGNGTAYWYDGDSDIGYRLYKEVTKVEFIPRLKGKGRLTQPTNSYQWETLATNLEEFVQISNKLLSSEVMAEAAVGKTVENEIIPILEKLQKKKERALKRQQKQTMLLGGFLNSHRIGDTRSQRNRRPVSYTFDEYDRSIDEAIQLDNSEKENNDRGHGTRLIGHHQKKKGLSATDVVGLRRSTRTAGLTNIQTRNNADTKRMLRERPTRNTVHDQIISDSEDENSQGKY